MPPPAEEQGPAPPGWRRWYSERRKKYYYHNDRTGEVQWTTPSADSPTVVTEALSPPAGQGASAARALTASATNPSTLEDYFSNSSSEGTNALLLKEEANDGSGDSSSSTSGSGAAGETVGLLQSLLPYYTYDDNTSRLVDLTIPSVPTTELDLRDDAGNSLLLLAVQYKAFSAMEPLVRLGADVNARNLSGSSALHYACHYDTFSEDVVRLLVAAGAEVNRAEDAISGGFTPLHYAAEAGSAAVCAFLVTAGADATAVDAYGRTAEVCARDAQQLDCAGAFATFASNKSKQKPSEAQSIGTGSLDHLGNGASSSSSLSRYKSSSSSRPSGGSGSSDSTFLALGAKDGEGDLKSGLRNKSANTSGSSSASVSVGASSEAMAKIQDTLVAIQSDLQSALAAKKAQKLDYDKLLKERDVVAQGLRDQLTRAEGEARTQAVAEERFKADIASLERQLVEATTNVARHEASLEEAQRSAAAESGRLKQRCADLEVTANANAASRDRETMLREAAQQQLVVEKDRALASSAEVLQLVRNEASAKAQLASSQASAQAFAAEVETARARASVAESALETSRAAAASATGEAAAARAVSAANLAESHAAALRAEEANIRLDGERQRADKLLDMLNEVRSDGAAMRAELANATEQMRQAAATVTAQQSQEGASSANGSSSSNGVLSPNGSSNGSLEELVAARAKVTLLEEEVARLRSSAQQSLFGDASKVALELASAVGENARLKGAVAAAELAQRQLEEKAATATHDAKADAATLRSEVQALRRQLLQRSSSSTATENGHSTNQERQQLAAQVSALTQQLQEARSANSAQLAALASASSLDGSGDGNTNNGGVGSAAALAAAVAAARAEARAEAQAEAAASTNIVRQKAAEDAALAAADVAASHAQEKQALEQKARQALDEERAKSASASAAWSAQVHAAEATAQGWERRVVEAAQEHAAAAASAAKQHARERESLAAQHSREVEALRREASDLREQAQAERTTFEQRISEANANAAEAVAKLATTEQIFARDLAEAEKLRIQAQDELRAMAQFIEEAKAIDRRNAILDARFNIELDRRHKLHEFVEDLKGKIRVYVRVRPLSDSEKQRGCKDAYTKNHDTSVTLFQPDKGPNEDKKSFEFDKVFAGAASDGNGQEALFNDLRGLVLSCVEGRNVCIFAYGQTGSGKTFSMVGPNGSVGKNLDMATPNGPQPVAEAGVTPRAVVELFQVLEERDALNIGEVDVSMYELYCDQLIDLLAADPSRARLKEVNARNPAAALNVKLAQHTTTGLVEVEGGTVLRTSTMVELVDVMERGVASRSTSATAMNSESSRSHLLIMLVVRSTNRRSGETVFGKLTLVDLAGSERVDKSGAEGQRLKEAASINKSLSAIGDVVGALTAGQPHVPYRSHALTTLMSDSIGGSAKTVMLVNCSPADYNVKESLSALGFAQRCKHVKNAGSGVTPAAAAAQVQTLKLELARLKKANAARGKAVDHSQMRGRTPAGRLQWES